MKKLVLCLMFSIFTAPLFAQEEWVSHPLTKYEVNQDNGRMKIYTPKYDYLVLDCMSFINEFSFYYNNSIERKIIVDSYQCESLQEYLMGTMDKEPVCMKMDILNNKIRFNTDKCD